jgi:hypothetical protein
MVALVNEDAVWIPMVHPLGCVVHHRWLKHATPSAISDGHLKYLDVDVKVRARMRYLWRPGESAPTI